MIGLRFQVSGVRCQVFAAPSGCGRARGSQDSEELVGIIQKAQSLAASIEFADT